MSTATTPPPVRPQLRRDREQGLLAGICAGLANHLGVDVAIVRIVFVVAGVLTSGLIVLVYLAGLVFIPAADQDELPSDRAAVTSRHGARDPWFWVGVALLVVGAMWLLGSPFGGPFGALLRPDLFWPLVLIGFGLALWRAGDRRGSVETSASSSTALATAPDAAPMSPASRPTPPAAPPAASRPTPPTAPAAPPTIPPTAPPPSPTSSAFAPTMPGGTSPVPGASTTGDGGRGSSPHDPTAPIATPPAGTGSDTAVLPADGAGGTPPPPPSAPASGPAGGQPAWTPPPAPPRRRSLLTRLTLGIALVAVGTVSLLGVAGILAPTFGELVAVGLLTIAVGLLIGAVVGRGRGLIWIGALLVPVVLVAELVRPYPIGIEQLRGPVGEIVSTPADLDDLRSSYQLGAGSLVLDLTDLDPDDLGTASDPTRVVVQIGAGEALVVVPSDVTVDVTGRTGMGQVTLFGSTSGGVAPQRSTVRRGDGDGHLELDLEVGLGRIDLRARD